MTAPTATPRPAPRWSLLFIAFVIASLVAGGVMALFEYVGVLLSLTTEFTASGSVANLAGSIAAYALMAGLSGLGPALLIGFGLWWLRVDNLAAYVLTGLAIAGILVVSGFGEISLLPAGPVAGLAFWAVMRLAR